MSILSDAKFVANFMTTNKLRITERYNRITRFLDHHRIAFRPSNAGFFLWADLFSFWSPRLGSTVANPKPPSGESSNRWELEDRLSECLLHHKVFLAAGKTFGNEDAGWFRITFTLDQGYLDEGLGRVLRALEHFSGSEDAGML